MKFRYVVIEVTKSVWNRRLKLLLFSLFEIKSVQPVALSFAAKKNDEKWL